MGFESEGLHRMVPRYLQDPIPDPPQDHHLGQEVGAQAMRGALPQNKHNEVVCQMGNMGLWMDAAIPGTPRPRLHVLEQVAPARLVRMLPCRSIRQRGGSRAGGKAAEFRQGLGRVCLIK